MKVWATVRNGEREQPLPWANHTDELGVVLAVTQLLEHAKSDEPWAPKIVAIHVSL